MKKKLLIIYYILAIIIIAIGFVVGTKTKEEDGGYEVYDYSHKVKDYFGEGSHYESIELGDKHIDKIFGWYMNDIIIDTEYYAGDIKLSKEYIEKNIPIDYYTRYDVDEDFHNVDSTNIIATIVMILIILVIPIPILIIIKLLKKNKKNNTIKEMKKLKEQLDLEMISKEEYEKEKNRILNK